jgi:tetratricopeptide (TPR) repeat protein
MKVFISSTYVDLIEHRKAAHDALERIGQEVGRMEIFGARADEATSVAFGQLEKSDLVVGIYAYRYGFIPEGAETSITEQEFQHARSKHIPVLCFVVHEDEPWPPKMMEKDPAKIKKLEDFKGRVLKEKVVDFFTTPADLGMKIATSVHNYLQILEEERRAADAKAREEAEAARQADISVAVNGSFNGNLTIGNQNSSNNGNFQAPAKPRGSTLPTQPYFFGREKERALIVDAISPESRTWGALIDGPGGIGKTALAIQAAMDAPDSLFERKIFITAKIRELKPEGEKPLTDFTRADYLSMLNELALELGEDGIPQLAPDARANALRLALANQKALIIFDNLETLHPEERDRLFQFLSRLPIGNKAIVTSRRRDNIDARVIRLERLELKESLQLMAQLALNNQRLARSGNNERRQLYEITGGNPLLIKWVCGQLQREQSHFHTIAEACDFIDKAPKGNDPLEYIFGDLLETFTPDETKVLAALTYFTQPAKLKWIADMTGLKEKQAETALEDLTDRSILTSDLPAQTYFLPPLTAKFIRTRRPEAVTQTGDALTNRATALAFQYGGSDNYEGFRTLDAEWDFVSAALPRLLMGDNDRLQTVCDQLDFFLDFTGKWDDEIWLNEQAEARAIAANDKENAGMRAYAAGVTYDRRNQPAEVLACGAHAAEHWQNSTPQNKALAIQLRGIGHELSNDYLAAIATYREVVEIHQSISAESIQVAVDLHYLATAEHRNKNYSAAERDYREALRIAKRTKHYEQIAGITGKLASLALDREQWAEAESLAREALALAEKVGRQELIANDCHRLAKALLKQNKNLEEALSLSRRAVEIFTRLRQSHKLQEAQKLLAEIEAVISKQ